MEGLSLRSMRSLRLRELLEEGNNALEGLEAGHHGLDLPSCLHDHFAFPSEPAWPAISRALSRMEAILPHR